MPTISAQFETYEPVCWRGRYSRIPGELSVFHLKYHNGRFRPAIYWQTVEGTATCYAMESEPVRLLGNAVAAAKRLRGGNGGGSFSINEFGQVLVPASCGSGIRFLVGRLNGNLLFDNPFDSSTPIDLSDTSGLIAGDPWKMPYVGIPFLLTAQRKISFQHSSNDGMERLFPVVQDHRLANLIYDIRRRGCRFIVNPAGIVLTKSQDFEQGGEWSPVFVGRVNLKKWFKLEGA